MKAKLKKFFIKGKILATPDYSLMQEICERLGSVLPAQPPISIQQTALLDQILIVGFHHKHGSLVEYRYPEEAEDYSLIAYLALPDCAHLETVSYIQADFVYFTLSADQGAKYCVGCYRQIPNTEITEEMNRNFVQKSVVVISNIPLYATITQRMELVTHAYFNQQNFNNTQILSDVYRHLQGIDNIKPWDLYIGFPIRRTVWLLKQNVFKVLKLILLEQRIIVYSKTSSQVSSFIMALLSLIPGQMCFGEKQEIFREYLESLACYGLPLEFSQSAYKIFPYFCLAQLDVIGREGYLIGCTNQMIIEHPKMTKACYINIDSGQVEYFLPPHIKSALKATKSETDLLKVVLNMIKINEGTTDEWGDSGVTAWEGSDDYLRKAFNDFFKAGFADLALLQVRLLYERGKLSDGWVLDCIGQMQDVMDRLDSEESDNSESSDTQSERYESQSKYKKFLRNFSPKFLNVWFETSNLPH